MYYSYLSAHIVICSELLFTGRGLKRFYLKSESFLSRRTQQLVTRMSDTPGESAQPSIVVHPSCLGRMEEFTPGSDWKHYVERLEMFFEVNSVPTDKRVPSILTLMGSEFGPYREEAIRDRFVCGLCSQSIQRKLLAEATLTLQTAVEKACARSLRIPWFLP